MMKGQGRTMARAHPGRLSLVPSFAQGYKSGQIVNRAFVIFLLYNSTMSCISVHRKNDILQNVLLRVAFILMYHPQGVVWGGTVCPRAYFARQRVGDRAAHILVSKPSDSFGSPMVLQASQESE